MALDQLPETALEVQTEPASPPIAARPVPVTTRLLSLDAYRGFALLVCVSAGLGLSGLYDDETMGVVANQLRPSTWEGCTFWDLIQPAFLFIVGVAMAFSYGRRKEEGQTRRQRFRHGLWRCLLLIAIGIFLESYGKPDIEVRFTGPLQQIALGYFVALVLMRDGVWAQAFVAIFFLCLHTGLFMLYDPDRIWVKYPNVGTALDELLHEFFGYTLPQWLGLPVPHLGYRNIFRVNDDGYVTLNALSSTATILFGVMAGQLLRTRWSKWGKLAVLIVAGAAGVVLAKFALPELAAYMQTDPVPIVPKIWTCTFTLFATGCVCLALAAFYGVIDVLNVRRWSLPLVVLGMNSLALYVMAELLRGPIERGLSPFITFPQSRLPEAWQPVLPAVLTLLVLWGIGAWLYRRRIFFKV